MSETMETVVVDDANAAHALIGRSIGGRIVTTFWAGPDTAHFLTVDGLTIGRFIRWGESIEVDALPPATMWVGRYAKWRADIAALLAGGGE